MNDLFANKFDILYKMLITQRRLHKTEAAKFEILYSGPKQRGHGRTRITNVKFPYHHLLTQHEVPACKIRFMFCLHYITHS